MTSSRRIIYVTRLLKDAPYTIEQLSTFFQVDRRTTRRWLEAIEKRGFRIVREGVYPTSPYRILRRRKEG